MGFGWGILSSILRADAWEVAEWELGDLGRWALLLGFVWLMGRVWGG